MSLIRAQRRSISYQDVWGSGDTWDQAGGTMEAALRLAPVWAAIRLIADQFCAAPLHGFRRRPDGTRERLPVQPRLLDRPSGLVGAFTWRHQLITSMLCRGNAYGLVAAVDGAGWPVQVEWAHPDRVQVDESSTRPRYFVDGRLVDPAAMVHIPWFVLPGSVVGLSPLAAFRTLVQTGQAAQDSARDWFRNGMIPSGHLRNKAKVLTQEEADLGKAAYRRAVAGRDVLVTGTDWEFNPIGVPADEARFVETLKLTATQVAGIYGVPAEMIGGETGSSLTYSTVEQNLIMLATFTLRPWMARVEDVLTSLLPRPQYARFELDALLRGDALSRMQSHEIALRTGVETLDEARGLEDRPPLSDEELAAWMSMYRGTPPPQQSRGGTQ